MDFMTPKQRSGAMSRVRASDTKIERTVRALLHEKGFRFRKNVGSLPGRPDIVLSKFNAVIFINGCFWHSHNVCKKSTLPNTRRDFWEKKINDNVKRDQKNINELMKEGWRVAVVWECALNDTNSINKAINSLSEWIKKSEINLIIPK